MAEPLEIIFPSMRRIIWISQWERVARGTLSILHDNENCLAVHIETVVSDYLNTL